MRFPDTLHAAATAENKQTDKQNIFCPQCIQPRPIHSNVGFNGVVGNISLASLPKTTKSTKRFCRKRKTRGLSFLSLCSIQSFLIKKINVPDNPVNLVKLRQFYVAVYILHLLDIRSYLERDAILAALKFSCCLISSRSFSFSESSC